MILNGYHPVVKHSRCRSPKRGRFSGQASGPPVLCSVCRRAWDRGTTRSYVWPLQGWAKSKRVGKDSGMWVNGSEWSNWKHRNRIECIEVGSFGKICWLVSTLKVHTNTRYDVCFKFPIQDPAWENPS